MTNKSIFKRLCSTVSQLHKFQGEERGREVKEGLPRERRRPRAATGRSRFTRSLLALRVCSAKPRRAGGLALLAVCSFKRGALLMLEVSVPHSEVGRDLQWKRVTLL